MMEFCSGPTEHVGWQGQGQGRVQCNSRAVLLPEQAQLQGSVCWQAGSATDRRPAAGALTGNSPSAPALAEGWPAYWQPCHRTCIMRYSSPCSRSASTCVKAPGSLSLLPGMMLSRRSAHSGLP